MYMLSSSILLESKAPEIPHILGNRENKQNTEQVSKDHFL